jgi:hypothetical protein
MFINFYQAPTSQSSALAEGTSPGYRDTRPPSLPLFIHTSTRPPDATTSAIAPAAPKAATAVPLTLGLLRPPPRYPRR